MSQRTMPGEDVSCHLAEGARDRQPVDWSSAGVQDARTQRRVRSRSGTTDFSCRALAPVWLTDLSLSCEGLQVRRG